MEFDNRYASSGKGNAALATGIIGTVGTGLGLLGLGNGLWGNRAAVYENCNGTVCSENSLVTRHELEMQQQLAAKDSHIALLEANTYNDQKNIEMYKYVDGRFREFEAALAQQEVFNQKTSDGLELVRKDIAMEAERRCCADNSIVTYANATFYPKLIAGITASTDAPTAQSTYNPIPNCKPCCNGNN